MSFLKHKPNLFLGSAELNRMQRFLDDDGYRIILLKNSASFGVVKYEKDISFQNFKVVEDVAGSGNFKIENESFAIDSIGRVIRQKPITNQVIPSDSSWYWIKIQHSYSVIEEGVVSIDINGNLTGSGTLFTEVLRGEPDFPSKISFPNSSKNILEYSIVEVVDDTTLLLNGIEFTPESGLTYRVVGTFTPGHVPSTNNKYPFQYDSCTISLVAESVQNTPPSKSEGVEFYIARVKNVGGVLTIQDKRTEQYKSTSEFNLTNIIKIANPLIGVENIKFMNPDTARDHNLVKIGFGMRTTAWTLDAPNRAITFSTGTLDAGKYKSTSQFSDDELNGWRVYFKDGSYSEIYDSEKQGTAIKCTLKEVDPKKLSIGDEIVVVPSVDRVELRGRSSNNSISNIHKTQSFEVSNGFGVLELAVPETTYSYIIEYRYIKGGQSSEWLQLPTDTSNGYYDESSFDDNGNIQLTTNRKHYTTNATTGFIELIRSSTSYIDFITSIQTGDKFGYSIFELDNGAPGNLFSVGVDSFVQRCKGVRGNSPMTVNHIIGLSNVGAKVGNSFTFIFNVGIADAGYSLTFNTGYVDNTSPGTIIKSFEQEDFDYPFLQDRSVVFKCTFNGTDWEIYQVEKDSDKIGDIKMISSVDLSTFPSGKASLGSKYQGWALCNGSNNTLDLRERFIVSSNYNTTRDGDYGTVKSNDYKTIGLEGGKSSYKLSANQSGIQAHTHGVKNVTLSPHTHNFFGTTGPGGNHVHAVYTHNGGGSTATVAGNSGVSNPKTPENRTDNPGDHYHNFSGTTKESTNLAISGSVDETSGDAKSEFENRPNFIVVGFIQRVKQITI